MFQRFIRAIKSMFGGLVSSMEDPKLILEQNIRELNDQIPQMNENIATVKANAVMLRKEVERYEKTISEVSAKIKAAINADRDDLAEGYALQLEKARDSMEHSKEQLKFADQAYEKALKVKKAFLREKDRKIKEAREALRASERAEWQSKVANALESFEMGGLDQTHNEMVNRLNERTAKNEARMEIALESVDTETMEIEANAEKLRAQELVNQFKQEMGKESAKKEKKIDVEDSEPEEKESGKTVGKDRTKA
jgi:phage shock protein A